MPATSPTCPRGGAGGWLLFNALPDVDGVVRSPPLLAEVDGGVRESLALAMLRRHAGAPAAVPVAGGIELRQGEQRLRIALDARSRTRRAPTAGWRARRLVFDYVSAADLLEGACRPAAWPASVVLSAPARRASSTCSTPVAAVPWRRGARQPAVRPARRSQVPNPPDWARRRSPAWWRRCSALLPPGRGCAALPPRGARRSPGAARPAVLPSPRPCAAARPRRCCSLVVYAITGWGLGAKARAPRPGRLFGTYVPPAAELVSQMARDPQRYTRAGREPRADHPVLRHAQLHASPRTAARGTARADQPLLLGDDAGDPRPPRHARQIHRRRDHGLLGRAGGRRRPCAARRAGGADLRGRMEAQSPNCASAACRKSGWASASTPARSASVTWPGHPPQLHRDGRRGEPRPRRGC